MLFFMVILIIIIFMIFNNQDKKSLFILLSLVPLTLMVFNIDTPDRHNYMSLYESVALGQFRDYSEIGMQIIIYIMTKLNVSFEVFINIFYLVALFLLARFMFRWSSRPSLVLLLYIIYPLFLDIVQIRTLMATAIVLNALDFLKEKNRSNLIKYILLVLFAGSIHNSAYFYLLYVFVFFSTKILSILASIALVVFVVLQTFLIDYIRETFPFLVTQLNRYTTQNISEASTFVLIVSYIVNICACIFYVNYIKKNKYPDEKILDSEIILNINIISICLIPFTLFALEFMRLYRMVMILNYTIVGNLRTYNSKTNKFKVIPLVIIGLIIISCLFSFYRYLYADHLEDVIEYLFIHNQFWNVFIN